MYDESGGFGDLDKIRAKHAGDPPRPRSSDPEIVVTEDLVPGDLSHCSFSRDRCEWGIEVLTSTGYPRKVLGTLVIRLRDTGELVVSLE